MQIQRGWSDVKLDEGELWSVILKDVQDLRKRLGKEEANQVGKNHLSIGAEWG